MHETTEPATLHLAPEEDIGGNIEIVGERQILVDGLDAFLARVDRQGEMAASALKINLALVGLVDAGDALDERRLAGAVVAEQSHNLAGKDVPAHRIDRRQAAEALGHLANGKGRTAHVWGADTARPTIRPRD